MIFTKGFLFELCVEIAGAVLAIAVKGVDL